MLWGRKTIGTIAYMGGLLALPEAFVWSWTQMLQFNAEYIENANERLHYTRAKASYHSFARNSLVDQFQGDWLLMLDTDHTFEPDLVLRMLNKFNNDPVIKPDVLIVPYVYKSPPHPPVLYGWDKKKKSKYILGDWNRENNPNMIQVFGGGGGCLLVRRKVFDKIQKKLGESPFDIMMVDGDPVSEDHSFFHRCHKLKIPVWAILDMEVNHLIYRELSRKDFKISPDSLKKVEI